MTKDKIREIFIEEATEIIEKLDIDIVDFEDTPEDKNLINELFRGVHTLKGSANSFGFNRLGQFVHSFEDVLDHYRSSDEIVTHENIDIFLQAVCIIKDVLSLEVNGEGGLPENFDETIDAMKEMISKKVTKSSPSKVSAKPLADLSVEFSELNLSKSVNGIKFSADEIINYSSKLEDGEELYHISFSLDEDIYFRGFDHAKLFKLLSEEGHILESWWDMSDIPDLTTFDPQKSTIGRVDLILASRSPSSDIHELFEYIEEHEFTMEYINKIFDKTLQEEMPSVEDDIEEIVEEKNEESVGRSINNREVRSFVKVNTSKLDELFASIGELVVAQNFIAENEDIKRIKSERVTQTMSLLSKITKLIQSKVMSLRMVAIGDTFDKMKLVARDASRKINKEISLELHGVETEIDKIMIDELSNPLIHLIRNAIDHGLESNPEDRAKLGKPAVGRISLRAFHKGGSIAIEVSDDGRGINRDKIFAKALEKGLVKKDDELSDSQIYALIMEPGFSTLETVTDLSGRGVGLDVVVASINKLHGKVEIKSQLGKGTTFTIILPLTLAIIDGMLVSSAGNTFIIPTLSVIESFFPSKNMVHTIKHKGEFVDLRGEMLPVVRLNQTLELDDKAPNIWESTLICVDSAHGKYTILIDDLIGRQQVVIKSLGPVLSRLKEFSGSAIMGSGEIALILNVEELINYGEYN
ncbi:Chemotaxis protein histidine kinase, cheA [Sulfurimonas gotlandica GD1]|uniref:Chemotaxis protein CheA n=1 Tax=Sulfurimonas gotlandica (strain DSM 19862 / JCM 16533 / GD1) TaxID=929558 RepID=B6BJA4_SULGG|nr:chemotaxis protein CheA [Sulfurimonas gotlandica]EDZ62774.1 CheA signal transduction histidine kinase [Sulfurimonas gotlandica GD1]EHP30625.1 Chemotaxis protein histidine kinase, cheA [Sulfurimonas gotlandica GD1]